jgi:D-proline reductase (dithiol) PrdB
MSSSDEVSHVDLDFWSPTQRDLDRLENWISLAKEAHEYFVFTSNQRVVMAQLQKPLSDCRVALVTTSGVHLKVDEPFDVKSAEGDPTFRLIPAEATHDDLMVSDTHFNTEPAREDINCLFPIERLRDIAANGTIGQTAVSHVALMGFNPQPIPKLIESAETVADLLVNEQADVVIMSPG